MIAMRRQDGMKRGLLVVALLAAASAASSPAPGEGAVQAFRLDTTDRLRSQNVIVAASEFAGAKAVKVRVSPDITPGAGSIDTATFALVIGTEGFKDGAIEVTLASDLAADAPPGARGFVGVAFRIAPDLDRFEAFYLRPTNGRADRSEDGTGRHRRGRAMGLQRHHRAFSRSPRHPTVAVTALARATIACRSTSQPAARSSGRAFSTSLWLMPFSHGTKIIAVGATRAM
jgi:hypothetical protein